MNYYKILNIHNEATLKEIKKNYKELSSKYHPDKNPNDRYSEEKMKLISEAYTTLSDYDKRILYDKKLINDKNTTIDPTINLLETIFNKPFNHNFLNDKLLRIKDKNTYSKSIQTESTIINGLEKTKTIINNNGVEHIEEYQGPVKNNRITFF
tara:strand:+ start:18597 stop:19055 length:459 start_codon:yes stop_codon:yes gene_type:complete